MIVYSNSLFFDSCFQARTSICKNTKQEEAKDLDNILSRMHLGSRVLVYWEVVTASLHTVFSGCLSECQ